MPSPDGWPVVGWGPGTGCRVRPHGDWDGSPDLGPTVPERGTELDGQGYWNGGVMVQLEGAPKGTCRGQGAPIPNLCTRPGVARDGELLYVPSCPSPSRAGAWWAAESC